MAQISQYLGITPVYDELFPLQSFCEDLCLEICQGRKLFDRELLSNLSRDYACHKPLFFTIFHQIVSQIQL
jgi:hypothetical protein